MAKDLSSSKERKKLKKKSFALPGKRKYPIPDKAHARNALARVAQHGTPDEQKKVKTAVRKRYPSLGQSSKETPERIREEGLAHRLPAALGQPSGAQMWG